MDMTSGGGSPPPDPPFFLSPLEPSDSARPDGARDDTLTDEVLARFASEWLTFERFRQTLLAVGADDPLLLQTGARDVRAIVIALLDVSRPETQRELARLSLYRALAGHPEFARLRYGVGWSQNDVVEPVSNAAQAPAPAAASERDTTIQTPPREATDEPEDAARATTPEHDTAFQVMMAQNDVFARWQEFQLGMERNGAVVCKISVSGSKSGTGFLVQDRLVLTTFHAIESLVENVAHADDGENVEKDADAPGPSRRPKADSHLQLQFLFDDIMPNRGAFDKYHKKVRAAREWLKACSPYDPQEGHAIAPLNALKLDHLDYALIELDEAVGRTAPTYRKGMPRNWIDLNDLATTPAAGEQMLIAQHPGGADLRLSVGLYRNHSTCQSRIRYQAPAVHGSSGSPCFNVGWKLYALHNAGYNGPPPVNQGIPVCKILQSIRQQFQGFSTTATNPAFMTAVTSEGDPILGRRDIAGRVKELLEPDSKTTTMIVRGGAGQGKTWTGRLIRSLAIDRGHDALFLDAERFVADTPERFARRLVDEVAVGAHDASPPPPETRQHARWIAMKLAEWTRRSAVGGANPSSGVRTLWIILDRLDEVMFTQETHDLLVALIADQRDKASPLRFVLLGYGGDLASAPQQRIWRTDLKLFTEEAIEPYIAHLFETHGRLTDEALIHGQAEQIMDAVRAVGIETIPELCTALVRFRAMLARKSGKNKGDDK